MPRSKQYQHIKESVPADTLDLPTAIGWLKEHTRSSFDETFELHIHLGVDTEKSDQSVRGNVVLPHGSPKKMRIAVFTEDVTKQKEAKAAGAEIIGGENVIADIEAKGSLDADVTIATPDMMPKVAKIAKILGPKGLMPNPKTGTVTPDVGQAVQELVGGKVTFKMDQLGNIHVAFGKASWSTDKLAANAGAVLEAVRASRPAAQKGQFILTVTAVSTMSPGIRVEV